MPLAQRGEPAVDHLGLDRQEFHASGGFGVLAPLLGLERLLQARQVQGLAAGQAASATTARASTVEP